MDKFYYNLKSMHNAWLDNPSDRRKVVRVEKIAHMQFFNKELATKMRMHLANDEVGILIEDDRNPISSMMPYDEWLEYSYYSLLVEGKDHCGYPVKYRFVVGVSDFIGNTESMERIAFSKLQRLLMTEGVGCLKTDTVLSKMQLTYEDIHE